MDTTSAASPSLERPTVDARNGFAPDPRGALSEPAGPRRSGRPMSPRRAREIRECDQVRQLLPDGFVTHAPLQG